MGFLSSIITSQPPLIFMIGLSKSGKRTLLKSLSHKLKNVLTYSGDILTAFKYSKFNILCLHYPLNNSIQNIFNQAFPKIDTFIFVVDSSNLNDLQNAKSLFQYQITQLIAIPLLLIISKYNLAQISIQDIVIYFQLIDLKQPWFVRTVGMDVSDLEPGLQWIQDQVYNNRKK